jgi:Flp pilus assembly protein CpaB
LKRSNRLVLLIGALLAVVAFVGIVLLLGQPGSGPSGPAATPPTTVSRVFAKVDIPLGTQVTADMLEARTIEIQNAAPNSIPDPSLVISQVIRQDAKAGTQLTYNFFIDQSTGGNVTTNLPQGLRAIAIQVDQVTGVGTLIHTGDSVDVIIGFKIQQVAEGRGANNRPDPNQIINVGAPQPSVKMIMQNLRVVGTILPPPTNAAAQPAQPAPSGSEPPAQQPGTTLNGQQEIVIVAATANQAEVIRYVQLYADPAGPFNAESIALVLRSPRDYVALDASGSPIPNSSPVVPPLEKTDGVILKTLVDKYGVLPPDLLLK